MTALKKGVNSGAGRRPLWRGSVAALCAAGAVWLASPPDRALAQAAAGSGEITVELNKLEPQSNKCRAYMVLNNPSSAAYSAFKLDLIVFQPDGVVGSRFAIDLAPFRPNKRTVKVFDIDAPCEGIGSLLVNDVLECKADGNAADDCLARLAPSSAAKTQFTK